MQRRRGSSVTTRSRRERALRRRYGHRPWHSTRKNARSSCILCRLCAHSDQALDQEIRWAAHLSVPAILLPPPVPPAANYMRILRQVCDSVYSRVSPALPLAVGPHPLFFPHASCVLPYTAFRSSTFIVLASSRHQLLASFPCCVGVRLLYITAGADDGKALLRASVGAHPNARSGVYARTH